MIAARLTALLPGRVRSNIATPQILVRNLPSGAQAVMAPRFILSFLFFTIAILFGTQMVLAQFHPAKPLSGTQTAASIAAPTRTPLPGGADVEKTEN